LQVVFIWAVLGMSLVSVVPNGHVIGEHFNFGSIGPACLLMLRVLTMDGWMGVLEDVSAAGGTCRGTGAGVPTWLGVLFFSSFTFIGAFVVLNIFIAVILVNFQDSALGEGLMELQSIMAVTHKQVQVRSMVSRFRNLLGGASGRSDSKVVPEAGAEEDPAAEKYAVPG
jgi:hypothetical protein